MAISDLMMQIRIAVTGDNGAVIRRLESQLRQLQATASQLKNISLAGLNADLAGLRSALGAAKILNLGTFPADLARFKSELLTATTAGANFRSVIKGFNNDSQKIRQLDIAPLRQQIQDINRALQTTKLTNLTPLQNSFRAASNDVLKTQINIRNLTEKLKDPTLTQAQRLTYNTDLAKANSDLNKYKNTVDQSRIAINSETSSLANSALARRQQVNALQSQISGHNQLILANQRSIAQERANLLAEERKAIAARNNVGLTQAQIKAEQEASRIRQDAIRTAISTKEQEIVAAKRGIAANQDQINSVKALLAQQKLLNRSSQSFSALKEFSSSIGFLFGPQMAGLAFVASVASMVSSFAQANKEVETLIRGLNAISSGNGRAEFEYLTAVSNKLGISIQDSAHSFLNLEATTAGTAIEGTKTKQIFESFARALNVTGADATTFNRAFRAVSQTLSKGQLYAEELKGQLAEALPGAIQTFAKSIDIAPKKFLEMVKAGQFAGQTLYDLYELVAKQLDKTYKVGSEQDFTFVQKAALAKNAFVDLSVAIGDTGIWKSASNVMLNFRDTLQGIQGDIPYLEENIRSLGKELKSLFPEDINLGGVGEALSKVGSFSLQSWFDIAANIRTVVEVIVNELANLDNEANKIALDIGTPIRESFERTGVYITTFFQNASSNVMQVITGMSLGFRETFYVPVVSIINDLISRIADINYSLSEALSFSGFSASAQYFLDLSNSLRSSGISMDEVNAKTESLRKEFTLLQNANKSGYGGLLQQGLDALAKQHKAVREEIEREYQANKAAAQAGIDAALALNESKKKQRDAQIELNKLLREQNEISLRERGSRNDILKVNPVGDEELTIAKSRFDYEKKILKIKQDQREAEAGFSKNLYQSWVNSGSMSQSSADFLSGLAEQRAALDTIKDAYAAIDAYNEQNINGSSELVKLHREMALEQIVSAKEMAKKTNNEYKYKELVKEELRLRKEGLYGGKGSTNEAAELIRKAKLKPIEEQEIIDVNKKAQEVLDSLKPLSLKSEISPPVAQNAPDNPGDDGRFVLANYSAIRYAYRETLKVTSTPMRIVVNDDQVSASLQDLSTYQSKIQDIHTQSLPGGKTEIIVTPKINESALQEGFSYIKTSAEAAKTSIPLKPIVDQPELTQVKKTAEQVKKEVLDILDKDGKKVNFIVSATGVTAANEDMKRLAAQKEIKVSAYTDQPSLEATKKKFDEAGGYIKDGLRGATTISTQGIKETLDKTFGKGTYKLEITPTLVGGVTEDGWIKNNEIKRNLVITPVAGSDAAITGMIQQQSDNIKSGYEGAWQRLRELDAQGQQTVQETPIQKKVTLDTVDAYAQDSDLVSNLSKQVTKYVNVVYRESGSSAPARAATGGYFPGYGGGDRIHALLEAGEFVLRKEAVRKLGLSNVFDLNNLNIPKPSRSVDRVSIPSFSSGGYVGSSSVINIHVPNGKAIQVTGSRESATALANLLTRVSRSV